MKEFYSRKRLGYWPENTLLKTTRNGVEITTVVVKETRCKVFVREVQTRSFNDPPEPSNKTFRITKNAKNANILKNHYGSKIGVEAYPSKFYVQTKLTMVDKNGELCSF